LFSDKEDVKFSYLLIIFFGPFYCFTASAETFEEYLDLNCENVKEIRQEISFIVEFSKFNSVDRYFLSAKKLIEEGCEFKSDDYKKRYLSEFKNLSKKFLNKGRRAQFNYKIHSIENYVKKNPDKCTLSINDINLVKNYSAKYGMKLPASLSSDLLDLIHKKDVNKFKENLEECFTDYLWHLSCGDHQAMALANFIKISEGRSIEKATEKVFQKLDNECTDPKEKQMVSALKEYMKAPVEDSLRIEYLRQEKLLAAIAGKSDHRSITKEMDRIVKKLNIPSLTERHMMLHERIRLPEADAYKSYQSLRKNKCTNIDNTNAFVRRNQSQAGTETCYAFGAANLMNYHLGVNGISPIYLMALSVSETDAFWYPIERGYRAIFGGGNSISSFNGGFSKGVIERAIKKGKFCSTRDVVDLVEGGIAMDELIVKTEAVGESAIQLQKNFKESLLLKEEFEKQILELFELVKTYFPKAKLIEFKNSVNSSDNGPDFFLDFVFSQCKTPLPKGAGDIKVEASYSFTDLGTVDIDQMDRLIENQNIAALGIQSDMLLKGEVIDSWSPHIVTLTGRRWNDEKKQCEFRIVNSWGESCSEVSNPEIECDYVNNELWVSELLIIQYGNSLTTITDSPMIKARMESNYEDFDPEF